MSIAKTKKQITLNIDLSEEADFLINGLISLFNGLEKFLFFEIKEEAILNFFRRISDVNYWSGVIRRGKNASAERLREFWKEIEGNFHFSETLTEEAKIFLVGIFTVATVMWIGTGQFVLVAHSEQDLKITNARATESLDIKKDEAAAPLKLDAEAPKSYSAKSQEEQCKEDKERKKSSELCGKDDTEELKKIEKERAARAAAAAPKPKPQSSTRAISCKEKNGGHPSHSDTKGKHMDEDCCPDPDEWPRPGCVYDARGYSIMLKR